jgi:dihydropteroate synthase
MKYNPTAPKVRPLVMGVLNTTPDSFSDGNQFLALQAALDHAKLLQISGADIIDVGGESTRPGAVRISVEEEQERVLPVIAKIVDSELGCEISIDTMNSETALAAVLLGAKINIDVSGGLAVENMFKVDA